MDLFGKNTAKQLEQTKQELATFVKNTTNTMNDFERMLARENGTSFTYDSLTKDFYKIGDPYLSNLYVRKAIDKIAGNIAGVSFDVVNDKGDPLPETAQAQKLFRYINDEDSSTDFTYEMVRSLQRYGKTFIRSSEEMLNGLPIALEVLDATKVKPIIKNGVLEYWEYNRTKITTDKMTFIRYKHPTDPYDGLAPGSSAIKEILLDFYASVYNIQNMKGGAQGKGAWVDPSGVNLTAQQKAEAQYAVDATFNKGVDAAGKAPVLGRKLEWIRTSETNRDMEYIQLAEKMRDDILIAYDIPKVLFTSAEATFTNLKEAKKMFWTQTLQPIIDLIEESFNTNFFQPLGFNYKLDYNTGEIPEMQDDIATKLESAERLYAMNVPMSIINEVLGLNLPESGWEGWDKPVSQAFTFDVKPEVVKTYEDFRREHKVEEEKQINNDLFYQKMEYEKSLTTMLFYEREISNKVKDFFSVKYKDVEKYIANNEVKSIKSLVDPNWIESFKEWLSSRDWGQEFVLNVKEPIETIFERGRHRTYWGIGADFRQGSAKAVEHMLNRGLYLKDSPQVVLDTIVKMLDSESFTIDQMAKEISTKWKDASLARAKVISITESTGAYNSGRVEGMKELGIKKKQWLHSQDVKVRDSHRLSGSSSIADVGEKFSNGLLYPGDGRNGGPEDICNCRCTCVSYLE